jgi:hypothetical protein
VEGNARTLLLKAMLMLEAAKQNICKPPPLRRTSKPAKCFKDFVVHQRPNLGPAD